MLALYPYQKDAIDALWATFRANRKARPLLVCPTGSGKSLICAEIIKQIKGKRKDWRILVVTHRKEIVEQNATQYQKLTGEAVGVVSAGLGSKIIRQVTFANIQSIFRLAIQWDVIMVDECHLISSKPESMYQKLFSIQENAPIIIGLTATPYRMDHGFLIGPGTLFTEIAYEISIAGLIENGYLAPLHSIKREEIDTSGILVRGNDFAQDQLEERARASSRSHAEDILARTAEHKHVLVFCSGVKHAEEVAEQLGGKHVEGGMIAFERNKTIEDFKCGRIKYLTNCDILTTGFNFPAIDCIVLLRPTRSVGLYVQMVGRGSRTAPGKKHCTVLDYGGNIRRHGPIDCINVDYKDKIKAEFSIAPIKTCDHCGCVVPIRIMTCPVCKSEFPKQEKLDRVPDFAPIIKDTALEVVEFRRRVHYKPGGLPSFRTDYKLSDDTSFSDFWCFDHDGFAQQKAHQMWSRFGGKQPAPRSSEEALERQYEIKRPLKVKVKKEGKYFRLTHVVSWFEYDIFEDDLSLPNL